MADWVDIPDTAISPAKPITVGTGFALRDNVRALAEGAPNAPRIEGDQGPAVKLGGLFIGSASVSGSLDGQTTEPAGPGESVTISLNRASFFPSVGQNVKIIMTASGTAAAAGSPRFALENTDTVARTYSVAWEFIQP